MATQLETTLMESEKALCASVQSKDEKTFKSLVAPHCIVAEEGKLFPRDEGLRFHVADVHIKSYDLSDFKVIPVTQDVAIVHMRAEVDASRNGAKLNSVNYVTTIWHNKDNHWQAVYSTSYAAS